MTNFSIIIPAYNESNNIEELVLEIFNSLSIYKNYEIIIIDDANPYNILDKENPDTSLSFEDKPIGGLGIYLVKHLMTNIDYDYRDGKNHLLLTKSLTKGDIN